MLTYEERQAKKRLLNDKAYCKKKGITLEQLYETRKQREAMPKLEKKAARRQAEVKYYAKKQGLTVEQWYAKQQAKKDAKAMRDKSERRKDQRKEKRRSKESLKPLGGFTQSYMDKLKEKHKQWEGTRLEKSIIKPVFLGKL